MIDTFLDFLIDDLIILINNSSGFLRTKTDSFYDSIIDAINNKKKMLKTITKEIINGIFSEIIAKNKNNKILKNIIDIISPKFLEKDDNYIGECLLKKNCLLLKNNKDETFEELQNNSFILKSYFDIDIPNAVKCLKNIYY